MSNARNHNDIRQVSVFYNGILAGTLTKKTRGANSATSQFVFTYNENYLESRNPSISFDLLKRKEPYKSSELFPYFEGLLPEGENREMHCRALKIDPNDSFSLLIKLANKDTIGAITVMENA